MMENYRLMAQIVAEMKEIPILPSEVPKDKSTLERVEFPDEGGVLTYMEGHSQPFRGFPYYEFVDSIDKIKKIGKAQLSGLYHQVYKGNKLKLLTLLPAYWVFKRIFYVELYMFYRLVERFRLKERRYCQAVRELVRCFNLPDPSLKMATWEVRMMMRDLLAMLLEFDNAYRFRFQDLMDDYDAKAWANHPVREIKRIIKIASAREKTQELRDFWSLAKILSNVLYFDQELRRVVSHVFSQLDPEKVRLTKEDKHYCAPRLDYNFAFMQRGEAVE